jgi:uncharacterized membrane protein
MKITRNELAEAQAVLFMAILLQVITSHISPGLLPGTQYTLIVAEVILAVLIGFTVNLHNTRARGLHHIAAVSMMALISVANISSLIYVLDSLITNRGPFNGEQLLASAVAIFITNVIVYALWYWEIDSPGLTRTRWSKNDKDFQFTQQDMRKEFPSWKPEFLDYFYLSVTNAVNFAPADTKPLTRQAKLLMASQALVSVFTLALVIARSVSILGS